MLVQHYLIIAYYVERNGCNINDQLQKQHSKHNTCARNALNDYPPMEPQKHLVERR